MISSQVVPPQLYIEARGDQNNIVFLWEECIFSDIVSCAVLAVCMCFDGKLVLQIAQLPG